MPTTSTVWSDSTQERVHESIHSAVDAIKSQQAQRIDDLHFLWKLYGARPQELYGVTHIMMEGSDAPPLPINIVSQVVDGFVSKIAKARPRVFHVPIDGDWTTRTKAQDRTKFIDGVWYETKFRQDARVVGLESAVTGTGLIKSFANDGRICHEVVPPEEVWIDPLDARYGTPRNMFQRRYVDRSVLSASFPMSRPQIDGAKVATDDRYPGYSSQADQVLVTEAWHLPSAKAAKDGRHVLAIEGGALLDEGWTWDRFPISALRFSPARGGFWSAGIVDQVYGIQAAISDLMEQILTGLREHGKARVLLERGSKVNPSDFTDDFESDFIEYTGRPPVIVTAQAVPSDVYQMVWQLVSRAFQQVGLSEMSAQAIKPAGLDSGVALRTYSDIESARHVLAGYSFEDWHLDVADLDLRVAGDLSKTKEGYSVLHVGRRYGQHEASRIKYWEPSEGEEYVLRAYPTNLLPETPAGKLAMLGELEDRGYLSPDEAMDLLDLPDLDRAISGKTAGIRTVDFLLDRMLSEGTYTAPDPALPLALAYERARNTYLLGLQDGIPEDRMFLVRRWMQAILDLAEPENDTQGTTESTPGGSPPGPNTGMEPPLNEAMGPAGPMPQQGPPPDGGSEVAA